MANSSFRSRLKAVVYGVLAFLLSISMFLLSLCITLEATFLNPNYIFDRMNSTNYFVEKAAEVNQDLMDLGYASGLDESFFDGLVDSVMISEDTEKYLENYYSGESNQVDRTEFKQFFNEALDEYIRENNIEYVNDYSRDYLVNKAAGIYAQSLQMPLFITLSGYLQFAKGCMPFLILGIAVFAVILCLVIVLTNKWKHRALRYLCCAAMGTTLSVGIIPIVVFASGYINKINTTSRALYIVLVECANNFFVALSFCALFFLVASVGLFFWHKKKRDKALGHHH